MKKTYLISTVVVMAMVVSTVPVVGNVQRVNAAQQSVLEDSVLEIPVNTIARGSENTEKVLVTQDVKSAQYEVSVETLNQSSVHPNTDIIVRSGPETVIVQDVESVAFKGATASDNLIVQNGQVTVSVRFGKDEVFSGGVKIVLTEVPVVTEEPPVQRTSSTFTEKPSKQVLPAKLPETGIGGVAALFTGFTGFGYIGHYLATRKRQ